LRACVLFSGGKDSTFALWCAIHQAHDVSCLLTFVPERKDSWMFHVPAIEWTSLQAEALGIAHVTAKTSGVKEEELAAMKEALAGLVASRGIECVVTGAVASEYQRSRVERVCDDLGIRTVNPLWMIDPARVLKEEIELGFKFILTACTAMGLDSSWLGRVIDEKAFDELRVLSQKHGINLVFEGGEAETFVTDAPFFMREVRILEANPVWKGDAGYLRIARAELVDKAH